MNARNADGSSSNDGSVYQLEVDLLLESVLYRYGYDFRQYSKGMLQRRLSRLVLRHRLNHVSELIPLVLHEHKVFRQFLNSFSITVSEFFRDPDFFLTIRQDLIPVLRTYPFISVWCAGCASGEEAYSWAVLLAEAGILERSRIYATDINEDALAEAREGIFSEDHFVTGRKNYHDSGGRYDFADYCQRSYGAMKISSDLLNYITFANHNLVHDGVFGEMVVISCRNVMIYFNAQLKEKCVALFDASLSPHGFLCLGNRESLSSERAVTEFEVWSKRHRIYRKANVRNLMRRSSRIEERDNESRKD